MKHSTRLAPGASFSRYPVTPPLLFPSRNRPLATTYQPRFPRKRQRNTAPPFFQQLDKQRIASRESNRMVFIRLVKVLLALSPLLLGTQWYLSATADKYYSAVTSAEASHHVLIENKAALESLRKRLSSPQRIRNMAAEKLSLHSPTKGQVELF